MRPLAASSRWPVHVGFAHSEAKMREPIEAGQVVVIPNSLPDWVRRDRSGQKLSKYSGTLSDDGSVPVTGSIFVTLASFDSSGQGCRIAAPVFVAYQLAAGRRDIRSQ